MTFNHRLLARSALALAVAVPAPALVAQQGAIEEVVVTARHRAESLQDTPVAVTAFSETFIENSFASQLSDMGKYAPNVVLDTQQFGGGALNASIRGLSYDEVEKTYEPAIGVSVDGMFFAHNSGAMIDMFDIESIEILRGPQGTLFGRNTMGGTIKIKRTEPSQEFGAKFSVGVGSYDARDVKARITGPLIDGKLAGKLVAYSLNGDSHTENYFTGEQDGGEDRQSFAASLLWTPTADLDVQLSVDYLDDGSEFPGVLNLTRPGEPFCDGFGACASRSYDIAREEGFDVSFSQKPFVSTVEAKTYNLNVDWRLDNFTLTSITAYNELEEILDQENTGAPDPDFGGQPFFVSIRDQNLEQWSQELRMTSEFNGPLNFVAGLFYFKSDYTLDPQSVILLGSEIDRFTAEQQLDSYAVYGEATYDLTDKARLIFGGRYTYEEKEFGINEIALGFSCPDPDAPAGAAACRDPVVDFDNFSPRVGIDYHFTENLMAYFTYSAGFRSGGWNGRAQTQASIGPYEPETLDNFEVGIRSDWLDQRLRVNATVFTMQYDDKQEAIIRASPVSQATETVVENASSAEINGLEMEVQASPMPDLQLRLSAGYLDASFDEFLNDENEDIKDQRHISYTPEWTFSGGADYFLQLEDLGGEVILTANYSWKDDYSTDPVGGPAGSGAGDHRQLWRVGLLRQLRAYDGREKSASFRLCA